MNKLIQQKGNFSNRLQHVCVSVCACVCKVKILFLFTVKWWFILQIVLLKLSIFLEEKRVGYLPYPHTRTHVHIHKDKLTTKKIQLLVSKVQESDNNLRKNVGIIFISSLSLKALKIRQYIQNPRGKCTYLDLIRGKLKRILIVKSSTWLVRRKLQWT